MSLYPLPQNFGYRAIKPPMFLDIMDATIPTKMNPNVSGCDLIGDPNILPFFTLMDFDRFTELYGIEIA